MELFKEFTSVEVSNKLHKAGFEKPSLFFRDWTGAKEDEIEQNDKPYYCIDNVNCYSATQLAEELPSYIVSNDVSCELNIIRSSVWRVYYGKDIFITANTGGTLADALGLMMVHLLENKLIS